MLKHVTGGIDTGVYFSGSDSKKPWRAQAYLEGGLRSLAYLETEEQVRNDWVVDSSAWIAKV